MTYRIDEIEGIGVSFARKLRDAGIGTTDELLDHCDTAKGRRAVAEATGLSAPLLLKWVNIADLMRVSGVGSEYSELLEAAGVDTVKELRTRNPGSLAARIADVNATKKLTRRVPSENEVGRWIEQAKMLDPRVMY